jgi:membrane-associated protein
MWTLSAFSYNLLEVLNVEHIIESGGLILIGLIVFAESGMLIGFFLPGDTLLFTAGFFAAQGKLPLGWLIVTVVAAAIIGDNVGYSIGKKAGPRIFKKKDGVLFRQEYMEKSEKFYEKHGGKTVLFARFVPVVRTFAPIVAGVGKMPRKRFVTYDIVGASVWGAGVTLLGYWLGSKIPNIDKYLLPIILLAMLISVGPSLYHIFGDKKTRSLLWQKIIKIFKRS